MGHVRQVEHDSDCHRIGMAPREGNETKNLLLERFGVFGANSTGTVDDRFVSLFFAVQLQSRGGKRRGRHNENPQGGTARISGWPCKRDGVRTEDTLPVGRMSILGRSLARTGLIVSVRRLFARRARNSAPFVRRSVALLRIAFRCSRCPRLSGPSADP
jgi:hypothetical protein